MFHAQEMKSRHKYRFNRDVSLSSVEEKMDQHVIDYIDANVTLHPSIISRARLAAGPVIAEVLVVTDFEFSKQFANEFPRLVEYIAVFFRSINLRYLQITEPRIIFRVRDKF